MSLSYSFVWPTLSLFWSCDEVADYQRRRLPLLLFDPLRQVYQPFNSRMGVGPIETIFAHGPERGVREMLHTTAVHFDRGFDLNRFAWVTNCWELSLLGGRRSQGKEDMNCLVRWLSEIRRRWPEAKLITQGEFGEVWRRHYHDNSFDYRFEERGSGIGGSDANRQGSLGRMW